MEAGARFPRRQGTGEAANQLLQLPGGPRHQEHCLGQPEEYQHCGSNFLSQVFGCSSRYIG